MPESVTSELIYEILKQVQKDLADIRHTLSEHSHQFIAVREELHQLRGDDLRRERVQAQMDVRLERMERRLSLNDPTH